MTDGGLIDKLEARVDAIEAVLRQTFSNNQYLDRVLKDKGCSPRSKREALARMQVELEDLKWAIAATEAEIARDEMNAEAPIHS